MYLAQLSEKYLNDLIEEMRARRQTNTDQYEKLIEEARRRINKRAEISISK